MTAGTLDERLAALVGQELVDHREGPLPVNRAMIAHWADAMGDANPVYVDDEAAQATGRDSVIAPPTMLQTWTMRTFQDKRADRIQGGTDAADQLAALLEEAGYTSVVATNCDQEYARELAPGDEVSFSEELTAVSDEKTTGLGVGRFVTSVLTYRDQDGEVVATQTWRLLRFRPPVAEEQSERPPRPRPAINRDNAFWFEAAKEHRLVIQTCSDCGDMRHPPGPVCPSCSSLDWGETEATGTGTVHTFTIAHHPRIPSFDYPLPVAVVELTEGTRLVAELLDVDPADIRIDMPVELTWIDADDDLTVPAFRPEQS